jgi:membrane-associated phospholipid phosphatase
MRINSKLVVPLVLAWLTGAAEAAEVGIATVDIEPPENENWLQHQVNKISHKERDIPWLTGDFNLYGGLASAVVIGVTANVASNDISYGGLGGGIGVKSDTVNLGDDFYQLLPMAGYVTSLLAKDYRGFAYMGIHNVVSSSIIASLKEGVGQRRPGDQSDKSFPSGHTNTAFLGAAFMQQRYGPRWGIPSYISAIAVAYTRVYGNKHYVNDTIAGASIAMMSAWAIVPPYEAERRRHWEDQERERPFSYEWEMTLNDVDRNLVQAPNGAGDWFTSPLDKQTNEPWANSHVSFEYCKNDRQAFAGRFSPWELRTFGQFAQPTTFAGETFPANEQLRIAHFLWDYGVQYRHTILKNDVLQFRLGAGVTGQKADHEIFVVDETQPEKRGQSTSASAHTFYAVGHADFDIKLFWKLYFSGEADYGSAGSSDFMDWSARLKLRFDRRWDASVGWREYRSNLDDSALRNDFHRSGPAFNFIYSF